MLTSAWIANRMWLAAAAGDARRFRRALSSPAAAQAAVLRRILQANRACEFGRAAGFDHITSPAGFQRRVPPAGYDGYAPTIARMAAGETHLLTAEPVLIFELSSGSTAPAKLIPYTRRLRCEFQAGLAAWITDTFRRYPDFTHGPAYWSVTPLTGPPQRTPGGTPIGFEDDSAYLGPLGRMVEAALAVPAAVKRLGDMDSFRYATLRHLLAAAGLRLISVWNPTFLTLLLQALPRWWDALLADLAQGTLTLPGDLPSQAAHGLRLRPAPDRAAALARLDPTASDSYAKLWPRLGLISCWADGTAARFAGDLAAHFPQAVLQPKGLLATEAIVSLPWVGAPAPVLAVTSHFLEFEAEDGAVKLAHELARGDVYTVLVTTGGGLYRYRLHDRVEVVGYAAATPCIRFLGKSDRVSDWFGEKLDEQFVAGCVAQVCGETGIAPRFTLVAPEEDAAGFAYVLYMEADTPPPLGLAAALDTALRANFHYDYCRRLGQLGPARVVPVQDGAATYLTVCQGRGMKLGTIKPTVLDRLTGWTAAFQGT
jgi:hypothetical protein